MCKIEIQNTINKINQYVFDVLASRKMKVYNDIIQYLACINRGKATPKLNIYSSNDKMTIKEFFLGFAIHQSINTQICRSKLSIVSCPTNLASSCNVDTYEDLFLLIELKGAREASHDHLALCNDELYIKCFNQFQMLNVHTYDKLTSLLELEGAREAYHEHLDLEYIPDYKEAPVPCGSLSVLSLPSLTDIRMAPPGP